MSVEGPPWLMDKSARDDVARERVAMVKAHVDNLRDQCRALTAENRDLRTAVALAVRRSLAAGILAAGAIGVVVVLLVAAVTP